MHSSLLHRQSQPRCKMQKKESHLENASDSGWAWTVGLIEDLANFSFLTDSVRFMSRKVGAHRTWHWGVAKRLLRSYMCTCVEFPVRFSDHGRSLRPRQDKGPVARNFLKPLHFVLTWGNLRSHCHSCWSEDRYRSHRLCSGKLFFPLKQMVTLVVKSLSHLTRGPRSENGVEWPWTVVETHSWATRDKVLVKLLLQSWHWPRNSKREKSAPPS